jgi:hypothetical protein
MRRKSLGLGGESEEEQMQARTQMAATSPEDYDKFFKTYTNLGSEEKERIKKENGMIGIAAGNLLELEDPQELIFGLTHTAKAFESSGSPKLAQRTVQLAQLAQEDPAAAREQLKALQAQTMALGTASGLADKGFADKAVWTQQEINGQLVDGFGVYDPNKKQTEFFPVGASIKETPEQVSTRKTEEAGEIEKAKLEQKLKLEPEIEAAKAEAAVMGRLRGEDVDKLNYLESSIPELKGLTEEMRKVGKLSTYTTTGRLTNAVIKELGLPAREGAVARSELISMIDNQLLPMLKPTFGSAFTEREGDALKATMGDPNSSPEQRDAALNQFISSFERQQRQLQSKLGVNPTQQTAPSTQQGASKNKYTVEIVQ